MPDKEYILIYRFKDAYTDYIHLNKKTFEKTFLKRLEEDEENTSQQLLFAPKKKKAK